MSHAHDSFRITVCAGARHCCALTPYVAVTGVVKDQTAY